MKYDKELEKVFENIGFERDIYGKILYRKYPNGMQIRVNRSYGGCRQIVNRSIWQRIKCRIWWHQHNVQINHCLSCGRWYNNATWD